MKKLTKKMIAGLEDNFNYKFKDHSLLERGFTHKSFINEAEKGSAQDNEKLEFLGDAVLSLTISLLLMESFPELDEGLLSKKRSSIVNEKTLAKLSRKMRFGDFFLLGKGEELTNGRDKDSLLADSMEAIIGAVYLDGGFDAAKSFVTRHFKNIISYSAKPGSYKDYKTLCQEKAQKVYKKTPEYRLISVKGPEHDKMFESEIFIGQNSFGTGKGRSKKDSEQKCARVALKRLEKFL